MTLGKVLLPIAVVAAVAVGFLYIRLLNGPISLKVLAEPIARAIAGELQSLGVAIEDALVRLNEKGGVEFRLRNVRLLEEDGSPVASAPLAAVELSLEALWSGRISPSKVVLIEPRLLLFYSPDSGLAVSFTRPSEAPEISRGTLVEPPIAQFGQAALRDAAALDEGPLSTLRQINVGAMIAQTSASARRRTDAASFLREIGLRNATVIFDHSARQSVWRVPHADISLAHKKRSSIISGTITVASPRGPWAVDFRTQDSEKTKTVSLNASIRDLVPATIAHTAPELSILKALEIPVGGDISLDLAATGELLGGALSVHLSRGNLHLPFEKVPLAIDSGRIELTYERMQRQLRIAAATLLWGQSRLTVSGAITGAQDASGHEAWSFDLAAVDGHLAAEQFGGLSAPIESWIAKGSLRPHSGTVELTQFLVRAGGGEIALTGRLGAGGAAPTVRLAGQISPMPASAFKLLWPQVLAPGARAWVGERMLRGQILGGTFSLESGQAGDGDARAQPEQPQVSLDLEADDVQLVPLTGLAPIEAPRALVRLERGALEVIIPDAALPLSQGRRLVLKAGRFAVPNVFTQEAIGELAFRSQGSAASVIEVLEQERFGLGRLTSLPIDAVDGITEGQFKLTLPLKADLPASDVKVEGRIRLTDGRARHLIGSYDAQAATITFDLKDNKTIDAKGDLLLAGVPAKVSWQRILGAPPDKQPPIRLTATLDNSDRAQLGLDVNHAVQGEVPVELTVTRTAQSEPQVHVWADLTNADLIFESVAWRKPPGRPASLQFDIAKGSKRKTELQNFKLVGDDVALEGWVVLDAQNRLREFSFPDCSINVVTRLGIQGRLRADNVWDVRAHGQTYDGRDFFRSLFSVGQLSDKSPVPRREQAGLDFKADIDTVIGFSDVSVRGLNLQLSKRAGKLTHLIAHGNVDGGKPIDITLQQGMRVPRKLVALTDDAGQVFRLVDFYPNVQGGRLRLEVNLDGRGAAEKTGVMLVERFRLLGDPVISEVLQFPDEARSAAQSAARAPRRYVRQTIDFDWVRARFSVGHGQFVLEDSEIRGPLLGATMRGKADFRARSVNLGGTYVPLQGLNSAVGVIPGLGQLLAGPKGEGVLGITFAIQGPMAQPQVLVNPLSLVAPGILREMFQMTNPSPTVTPRPEQTAPSSNFNSRAPSAPATGRPAAAAPRGEPEASSGWSSETIPASKRK